MIIADDDDARQNGGRWSFTYLLINTDGEENRNDFDHLPPLNFAREKSEERLVNGQRHHQILTAAGERRQGINAPRRDDFELKEEVEVGEEVKVNEEG